MTSRTAKELLQQVRSLAGSQMGLSELAKVAGPGFCSLLTMTISTIQASFASSQDGTPPVADGPAAADLEVVQEAAWEKLHTGCWKDVEPAWRDAYALACLLRALLRLSRLQASPPAVSKPTRSAAAPESLPSTSDGASQPKCLQLTGQQVDSSGKSLSTEAQPALHEGTAAQSLICTQQPASMPRCGGLLREESARQGCRGLGSVQHTGGQENELDFSSGEAVLAAMRELDLGIMMGGHTYQDSLHAAIAIAEKAWHETDQAHIAKIRDLNPIRHLEREHPKHMQIEHGAKRKRPAHEEGFHEDPSTPKAERIARTSSKTDRDSKAKAAWALEELCRQDFDELQQQLPPGSLDGKDIASEHLPSLDRFVELYMCSGGHGQPCRLEGCMTHWPALDRWQHPEYLLAVAGQRTVPIELGKHYLEDGWGQSLTSMGDFLRRHIMQAEEAGGGCGGGQAAVAARAAQAVGYLAQHPLFDQIPELARDIREPEYCSLGKGVLHSVNAWFGPAGTVTPLHHDPHHNVLAQVVGLKYVRLYPPSATCRLYPYQEGLTTNASQVDLAAPDLSKYPDFEGLPHQDTLLQPGEMLYIPPGWWHYVQSLSVSFSVSFWWS